MGDPAALSRRAARTYAVDLAKIANDLRLLVSGPRTGLDEIRLPAVQPGSSHHAGQGEPVDGRDGEHGLLPGDRATTLTVATAAEAGQLELNVMMPVIAHNLFVTLGLLTSASRVLAERCVEGIEADAAMCAHWLDRSPALVTALAPKIGYAEAAKLAKEAVEKNLSVRELLLQKGMLKGKELDEVLDLHAMTEIGVRGIGGG